MERDEEFSVSSRASTFLHLWESFWWFVDLSISRYLLKEQITTIGSCCLQKEQLPSYQRQCATIIVWKRDAFLQAMTKVKARDRASVPPSQTLQGQLSCWQDAQFFTEPEAQKLLFLPIYATSVATGYLGRLSLLGKNTLCKGNTVLLSSPTPLKSAAWKREKALRPHLLQN